MPRLFLHVGPPKTGTTYLQGLLDANRQGLRSAGVDLVGTHDEHFRAANELTGRPGRRGEQVPVGAFEHVQGLLARTRGDAVASCERYSLLGGAEAARVLEGFPGRDLHLVLTLRDPVDMLPSQWQEYVKNGADLSWERFCGRLAEEPRYLRRWTRVGRVLRAWSGLVPAECVHVVTVPPPGAPRTLLRDRFCRALDVDPGLLVLEPAAVNESVDLVGAELVRRLNRHEPVSAHVQHSEIKTFLVREVLAGRDDPKVPRLTGPARAAARAEAERMVGLVRRAGHPVHGDLDDLVRGRSGPASSADGPPSVTDEEVLDVALASIAALATRSFDSAHPDPTRWRGLLDGARRRAARIRVGRR